MHFLKILKLRYAWYESSSTTRVAGVGLSAAKETPEPACPSEQRFPTSHSVVSLVPRSNHGHSNMVTQPRPLKHSHPTTVSRTWSILLPQFRANQPSPRKTKVARKVSGAGAPFMQFADHLEIPLKRTIVRQSLKGEQHCGGLECGRAAPLVGQPATHCAETQQIAGSDRQR